MLFPLAKRCQERLAASALVSDLFPDRLELFFEDWGEGEELLEDRAAIVGAVRAGHDAARGGAKPDAAGRAVGRALPFARRAAVADAHLGGDILGAELRGPLFRGLLESGPIILLGGDVGLALAAVKTAVSLDLGHVFTPRDLNSRPSYYAAGTLVNA